MASKDVSGLFGDGPWAERFPPILNPDQAAALVQVPKQTIYAWSSQGLLDPRKARAGRHLRLLRDKFVKLFMEGGLNGNRRT